MKCAAVIIDNRKMDFAPIYARHMRHLPHDWELIHFDTLPTSTPLEYNTLLTSANFWSALLEFDRVLIFQHDSGLLRSGIDEFLEWDYIGAAWKFSPYVGNGGLSLRNPDTMYQICLEHRFSMPIHGNEDVFFANIMTKNAMKIAPICEAKKFSVETIFGLGSLGYHAINKYLSADQVNQIMKQYE